MKIVPSKFFLTKGVGIHEKELRAFEEALRDAKINRCNLIKTSSIIAPGCKRISVEEGIKLIPPGQITFAVIAQSQTNEPDQMVSAAIAMAQPKDKTIHGYLTEVEEAIGISPEDIEEDATEMAIENLISEYDPEFDGDDVYRKGKKNYSVNGMDFTVDCMVSTAKGVDQNKYVVVLVAAVFIYEDQDVIAP